MTKITNVEVIRLKAKQPSSPNYVWDQPVARPYDKYPESLYNKENWMAIGAGEVVVKTTIRPLIIVYVPFRWMWSAIWNRGIS